jgi:chitin disaccharide deacetylase
MEILDSMRFRRIIVNADDFGMSAETNRAIVEAFQRGVISSTTVMANMPGFEEACELARRYRLSGKIGVHLNLTEGRPLTEPIQRLPRFCDEQGLFRPRRTLFRLSKEEKRAVEAEFAAQIQACIERGVHPTHLDSHQHVHTEWPIGEVAIRVAHRYGIGAIRLTRNCGTGIGLGHMFYKAAYNARLRIHGLAKTRYFGSATDVPSVLATTLHDVEVMVHLTVAAGMIPDIGNLAGIERWVRQDQIVSYA